MTIILRKATEQDIPLIAALASKAFHPASDWITRQIFPLQLQPPTIPDGEAALPWRLSRKTASLRGPNTASIVAVDTDLNDQVVGFALWDLPVGEEATEPEMVTPAEAELPADVTDLKAYAQLQSILKEDHQATFGDRGLKDVWRVFSIPTLLRADFPHSLHENISTSLASIQTTNGEALAGPFYHGALDKPQKRTETVISWLRPKDDRSMKMLVSRMCGL
ncbi:hypothetical protein A9Z42_0052540 [Trichoderma parareesei]|uniref:N-acetyltransferase domain-containing protein n=1 Tax=Trichoderma parareesei TaxID=858221 RepID=A0A2H2ZZW6_TRIPA|nr:hypothetical protein A9Z42_0052540 [Trichoderma parareesei]